MYDALHDGKTKDLLTCAPDTGSGGFFRAGRSQQELIAQRDAIAHWARIMKLLWEAVGTEFGGPHELYEMNHAGNHEDIRIQAMWNPRMSGTLDGMVALAEQCLTDYDENGWARYRLARPGRRRLS